jgi:hypothetical protein
MSDQKDTHSVELTEELKARQGDQITDLLYPMYAGSLCLVALFLAFVLYIVIKIVH